MQFVPPWLEKMLSTEYFLVCRTHQDAARSECNMYCLDCNEGAFCIYCKSSLHKDHQVIQVSHECVFHVFCHTHSSKILVFNDLTNAQIRRSSYHEVVRVSEIESVLNVDDVQTYVINSAKVLFLNERPQLKASKGGSRVCHVCGRSLLDLFVYCSLGCKLVGIKRNENASFILEGKSSTTRGIMSSTTRTMGILDEEHHHIYTPTPSSRRRKGIPHRAPN